MMYTTMTRNRLLRLTGAKGWILTQELRYDLYRNPHSYYEVSFDRRHSLLRGRGYYPYEDDTR